MGPLGPRCLAPDTLAAGTASETRACGLPRVSAELGDACVVVSVGAPPDPNDWAFEAAAAAAAPNCSVWSFDCLARGRAPPAELAARVFARDGCLGASTHRRPGSGLPVLSYHELRKEIGIAPALPIALLRLDVEGWEYEALRAVAADPAAHAAAPAEVSVRLHFRVPPGAPLGRPWRGSGLPGGAPDAPVVAAERDKGAGEIGLFVDHLWRTAGFYPTDRADGAEAGWTELLLVRGPRHGQSYEDWEEDAASGQPHHQRCAASRRRLPPPHFQIVFSAQSLTSKRPGGPVPNAPSPPPRAAGARRPSPPRRQSTSASTACQAATGRGTGRWRPRRRRRSRHRSGRRRIRWRRRRRARAGRRRRRSRIERVPRGLTSVGGRGASKRCEGLTRGQRSTAAQRQAEGLSSAITVRRPLKGPKVAFPHFSIGFLKLGRWNAPGWPRARETASVCLISFLSTLPRFRRRIA